MRSFGRGDYRSVVNGNYLFREGGFMKHERIIPHDRWEITNGDYFEIMRHLASKKMVKIEGALVSPKGDRWLKRIASFLIMSLGAALIIHVLLTVIR
jgi:hypothetical protein